MLRKNFVGRKKTRRITALEALLVRGRDPEYKPKRFSHLDELSKKEGQAVKEALQKEIEILQKRIAVNVS